MISRLVCHTAVSPFLGWQQCSAIASDAHLESGRYAALACQPPLEDQPVKKILLLLVVIAIGAVIAKKVRSA